MRGGRGVGSVIVAVAVVVGGLAAPASAAGRVGAPWVVGASPTSLTLDWPGGGSFRVHAKRQAGGGEKSVRTKTSTGTVKGLRPGTMYCFRVTRSNGSASSQTYCHSTTTRVRAAGVAGIGVATFNVCGEVCGRWTSRRGAVVSRIVESAADVVTVQEVSRRIPELAAALDIHGFDLVANTQNEAIFARRGILRREAAVGPGCYQVLQHEKESKFPGWDKARPQSSGGHTYVWDESSQVWESRTAMCRRGWRAVTQDEFGTIVLPHRRTAAWASLLHVASGRHVTVATTHLIPGSSASAARKRRQEARELRVTLRARASGQVVITGDLNSSRARGDDTAARELRQAGVTDAYDRSTTYDEAWVSSSNGFASRARRDVRYGDHIDRIFVPRSFGVSDWRVVAPLRRGRNVRPIASDHHAVRATVWLP